MYKGSFEKKVEDTMQIKIVAAVIVCFALLTLVQTGFAQKSKREPVATEDAKIVRVIKDCYVPYINTKRLFADAERQEYPISPDVEVRENGKKGLRLNIKTIAGVGFITKAEIYIMKNQVVKIVIIDLQQ